MFLIDSMNLLQLCSFHSYFILSYKNRQICWRELETQGCLFFLFRNTVQDIHNAMGSMYAAVLFIGITNGTASQPVVSIERFVSYRERGAGMYSPLAFAFAQVGAITSCCVLKHFIFLLTKFVFSLCRSS